MCVLHRNTDLITLDPRWLVHQGNINTCQYVEQAGSLLSYLFYLLLTKWRLPCFCLALQ